MAGNHKAPVKVNGAPEKNVPSIVDEYLKSLEKLNSQRDAAIKELLDDRAAIDEKLAKIGYTVPVPTKADGKPKQTRSKGPCPVCNVMTEPWHDGRHKAHRAQGEKKKAFTDAELQKLGMKKVEVPAPTTA